ncbi:transcriptional regulator, XRE family with cupin sensor [Variovorax sp. HW608]|uniref:helix-turn-helix domain-containing protein n=1 Tax=Variovorax sp. HW608 TaxID=1034889 RepID=UPI00081FB532|nr:XRE family transcriptional regulator [Variovorax sp. HW608]SCK20076.1 transcriptional regulator, XRE family with cupin sensor [Variovorax sp. HW608]
MSVAQRKAAGAAKRPTKAAPAAGKPSVKAVGLEAIVKALRHRAGLTLTALADRANLAISTLSKIEAGQLSPGYETIQRLAVGLGVDAAELFMPRVEPAPAGRRGVTKRGQGVRYASEHYEYEALAADLARKQFLPLTATIKARSPDEFEGLPSHEGEEFVYVVSGSLELHSEHYEPLKLGPGDSVYFDSRAGHALVSTSKEDAKVVWICSDRDALSRHKDRDE